MAEPAATADRGPLGCSGLAPPLELEEDQEDFCGQYTDFRYCFSFFFLLVFFQIALYVGASTLFGIKDSEMSFVKSRGSPIKRHVSRENNNPVAMNYIICTSLFHCTH
jgi:hypothetical protein